MEIEEIETIILLWNNELSDGMKKYIHYRSIRNFVLHYNEIKSKEAKEKIVLLLSDYVQDVKENNYDFDASSGYELGRKYLSKISNYYREYSGFMGTLKIKNVFLWGVLGDALLLFSGLLAKLHYIPIVTCTFFLYYVFIAIFKEPKGRVYGLYY